METNRDLHEHDLKALLFHPDHSVADGIEHLDAGGFEERQVASVIDVVIGVQVCEPNRDRGLM